MDDWGWEMAAHSLWIDCPMWVVLPLGHACLSLECLHSLLYWTDLCLMATSWIVPPLGHVCLSLECLHSSSFELIFVSWLAPALMSIQWVPRSTCLGPITGQKDAMLNTLSVPTACCEFNVKKLGLVGEMVMGITCRCLKASSLWWLFKAPRRDHADGPKVFWEAETLVDLHIP